MGYLELGLGVGRDAGSLGSGSGEGIVGELMRKASGCLL